MGSTRDRGGSLTGKAAGEKGQKTQGLWWTYWTGRDTSLKTGDGKKGNVTAGVPSYQPRTGVAMN